MSLKNKETRRSQGNACHTTGSRGFAVVHDQQVTFTVCVQQSEIHALNLQKMTKIHALNL
jgi:hypothetical protein